VRGNITRRGKSSWRLKFDVEPDATGKRQYRVITVRGTRKDAEAELARLLNHLHKGTLVDASKVMVGDYLRGWLNRHHGLSPTSIERYRDIIERQTNPVIGKIELQKLKPVHVRDWLSGMLKSGGRDGRPLSARSVTHAHRVIRAALQSAVELELLARNVADVAKPPKVEAQEIEILTADQIATVLDVLKDHSIYPIVALALATGMRRGELLALRWQDVDLRLAVLSVERSLEQTKPGLRFKGPKSKHGRRAISLPASTVAMLRDHKRKRLELRMRLGMGKPDPDGLVFCGFEGEPISPNYLSILWRRAIEPIGSLPKVTFHALRHSHASAVIAAGIDVVTVSRRLGHGSPAITLNVYAHLFHKSDVGAAGAIEKVLS
jgi:integrase